MKIIDCFIFYNELELLTYRLNLLYDVVDYFVIVESTHTHVGKEKALIFQEFKYLYDRFKDKIVHVIVDDFPHKYPNIDISKNQQWVNERFQRDQIKRGLDNLSLYDEDVIIITDLDEIPDPNILSRIKNNEIQVSVHVLEMDLYYYNLNTKLTLLWPSARIISFKKYNELSISCNDVRFYNCQIIKDSGWHLSYFGDSKFIKNKIENFTHQEYNSEQFTDIEEIEKKLKNFDDIYHRNIPIIKIATKDNPRLPPLCDIYLKNFILF
jgi:beta-1,4-mannosyl-glycoprotein beta-1,4-N-acetylglucosaminyltransferase